MALDHDLPNAVLHYSRVPLDPSPPIKHRMPILMFSCQLTTRLSLNAKLEPYLIPVNAESKLILNVSVSRPNYS